MKKIPKFKNFKVPKIPKSLHHFIKKHKCKSAYIVNLNFNKKVKTDFGYINFISYDKFLLGMEKVLK